MEKKNAAPTTGTKQAATSDKDGKPTPVPGDNVVPFGNIPQKQDVKPAEREQSPVKKEQDGKATTPPQPTTDGKRLPDKNAPAADGKSPTQKEQGSKSLKSEKPKDKSGVGKPEQKPKSEEPKKAERAPRLPKAPQPAKQESPPAPAKPEQPPAPRDATRSGETEKVMYLNLSDLYNFKNHPFGVRDDAEMKSLIESVGNGGVNQPALVRPREGGGYELVAGHRRKYASEFAGYKNMPCIVRKMTDDEAILAMTDDNLRQRSEILPSEKAIALKMQVDAISHQGARTSGQNVHGKDAGKRSVDIVGERNGMNAKQVQRYISLTKLVPDLMKMVDEKQLGFTPALEFSFIKPKNQNLIAVSIEGEQAKPSLSQAQRLRELDMKGQLNGDMIDGILSEEKKEVDKVILTSAELNKYFVKDKTPRQMKDTILKLLDDMAAKEKAHNAPEKKPER